MAHLIRAGTPSLRRPVMLAAFEGWNDAGDAATFAVRFLADRWDASPFASIDPEEFFDFTSTRPTVQLDDEGQREIVWPSTTFASATVPGSDLDVICLQGTEPELRWRTFCAQVVEVAAEHDVRLVVTLGALLAEVPHTRPVNVVGTSYDPEMVQRLHLRQSKYEGPTGIVGVLHDAFRQVGVPTVSLWAAVPTYVPGAPSPKAALALVQRTAQLLSVPMPTTDLEIASAAYERQIDELVADDDDTAAYVARLEQEADTGSDSGDGDFEDTDPAAFIEEVERYLRDQ
jgi:proteasome assembly chaperone (PAC2) family protein